MVTQGLWRVVVEPAQVFIAWPDTSSLRFWGWFQVAMISSMPASAALRASLLEPCSRLPSRLLATRLESPTVPTTRASSTRMPAIIEKPA